jgi:hypothetical protein
LQARKIVAEGEGGGIPNHIYTLKINEWHNWISGIVKFLLRIGYAHFGKEEASTKPLLADFSAGKRMFYNPSLRPALCLTETIVSGHQNQSDDMLLLVKKVNSKLKFHEKGCKADVSSEVNLRLFDQGDQST